MREGFFFDFTHLMREGPGNRGSADRQPPPPRTLRIAGERPGKESVMAAKKKISTKTKVKAGALTANHNEQLR